MIVDIENLKDSTKKQLDLISECAKTVGYKDNIQNLRHFYTPTMKYQEKSGEKIPFAVAKRKNKVGINLTKEVKTCTQKTTQH